MCLKKIYLVLLIFVISIGSFGCSCVFKGPHRMGYNGIEWQPSMTSEDYVVLDAVEGVSDTTSIFFGLIKIIEGNKIRLLWFFPFYEDKYSLIAQRPMRLGRTGKRAYYNALKKAPDADVILEKSVTVERKTIIPLLYRTKRVTYKGRAIKLKADSPSAPVGD
jgi:hypothetical protein